MKVVPDVALHEVRIQLMVNVVIPDETSGANPDHAVGRGGPHPPGRPHPRRGAGPRRPRRSRGPPELQSETAMWLRQHSAGSARAEERRLEAETLERAADWMDGTDPTRPGPASMLMHYESHMARRRRHDKGPGPAPGGDGHRPGCLGDHNRR